MRIFLALAALILFVPVALAEAPSYVTGLEAEMIEGELHLKWQPVPETDVVYYRVFYSYESILANEGLYDDFETTEGPEAEYVMEELPDVETLYIAVIAVNEDGEDSGLFVEEIAVQLDEETTTPSTDDSDDDVLEVKDETLTIPGQDKEEIPDEVMEPADTSTLKMLSVVSESPTMVVAEFSHPVTVAAEAAPQAVRILDSTGNTLGISRLTIEGTTMRVETLAQVRGASYTLQVSEPFMSPVASTLDVTARSLPFVGHPTGIDASMQQTQGALQALQGLKLTVAGGPALFSVTAEWMLVGNHTEVAHYAVQQSRDGGKTLSQSQLVAAPIRGIRIDNITPGPFGLSVTPVKVDGTVVPGEFATVMLGNPIAGQPGTGYQPPLGGMVGGYYQTPSGGLTDSGVGMTAVAVAAAGALAGWYAMRKRKALV
jgi:hypothetical protein